jgi:hypothetical protein
MAATVYLAFVNLFAHTSPVPDAEREWVETRLRWLESQFGDTALRGPAILPTDEFFPGVYVGDAEDVRMVVDIVGERMGVEPDSIVVEFGDAEDESLPALPGPRVTSGAAGEYWRRDGQGIVAISMTQAKRPMALVATVAHELAHHLLFGKDRLEPGRRENETLVDLATVFFGLGVFGANAAVEYSAAHTLGGGWRATWLGYLTAPVWGYALAYWAHMRGERDPGWARHLDTNPRVYMKRGLRYLG